MWTDLKFTHKFQKGNLSKTKAKGDNSSHVIIETIH